MMNNIHTYRRASISDLKRLIELLLEDELGSQREAKTEILDPRYLEAFNKIDKDPNQFLMVVEKTGEIVGTCHLTIMPSLTFIGSTRAQIEAVRIASSYRGQKLGEQMIKEAISYAKTKGASIIQLTTNKKRDRAKHFYKKLGFAATHEGMKLYL